MTKKSLFFYKKNITNILTRPKRNMHPGIAKQLAAHSPWTTAAQYRPHLFRRRGYGQCHILGRPARWPCPNICPEISCV